jgi:hypothetical protein
MPRFYFDVYDGETFTPDESGQEFKSLLHAEREAIRAASDIERDFALAGKPENVRVEILDERRILQVTVSTGLQVERHTGLDPANR